MNEKILVASFQSLTATSAGGIGQLAYKLSAEFQKLGVLKAFVVSSKGKFSTSFPSTPVSYFSKYYLYLINKFGKRLAPYKSRYIQETLYDVFCSTHIDSTITKLVVTTPYLYRTFTKARKLGIRIYFIPGNPEDNYIKELVKEENRLFDIKSNDAYTYRRRLNFYNKSLPLVDKVVTYSSVMEDTYRNAGHGNKIISLRGYLKPNFNAVDSRTSRSKEGKFKVCFLAYTVLLKGLHYVLEAWKELQYEDMELHIGGGIDGNVQKIINERYSDLKNVHYHGNVSDVASFFEDKFIYILPSLIDGAPVSILEAMQNGVPSIVSVNCGTKDIIEEGKSGWIIPIRNAESIKAKILEAYQEQEELKKMGRYAQSVISKYDMNQFVQELTSKIMNDIN